MSIWMQQPFWYNVTKCVILNREYFWYYILMPIHLYYNLGKSLNGGLLHATGSFVQFLTLVKDLNTKIWCWILNIWILTLSYWRYEHSSLSLLVIWCIWCDLSFYIIHGIPVLYFWLAPPVLHISLPMFSSFHFHRADSTNQNTICLLKVI